MTVTAIDELAPVAQLPRRRIRRTGHHPAARRVLATSATRTPRRGEVLGMSCILAAPVYPLGRIGSRPPDRQVRSPDPRGSAHQ